MPDQADIASVPAVNSTARKTGVTVRLTFPGRRYHATPWGHHVNEGLVEWPPSPWRVLRSLLATGYSKLQWPADGPPQTAVTLLEKLSNVLPRYRLPKAVGAHSRHYMPMARFDKGREQTTLVLDTWAQVEQDWLGIHWDVELDDSERDLLGTLIRELGYLGRSESWVEGELSCNESLDDFTISCSGARPGTGWQQVALLAPEPMHEYARWREASLEDERRKLPTQNAKGKPLSKAQLAKQRDKLEQGYPKGLVGCLQVDTRFIHDLGWSQPPGTRKVFYWRPTDALSPSPTRIQPRREGAVAPANFVLLALAAESNNNGNLPSTTRTLPQGELLHRALISRFPDGNVPEVLSGRDISGNPLRGETAHRHLHILHLDLDGDQHLDHVLLWAPMGLDSEAQRAVRAIRHEVAKKAKRPHRVAVAAMGRREDMLEIHSSFRPDVVARLHRVVGTAAGSREWVSLTPFVAPRFLKPSGKNSLEGQVLAELAARGLPAPLSIEVLEPNRGNSDDQERARKARHFIRRRRRGALPPPVDCGFTLRLTFSNDVRGPLLLGYGCHFGLGAFESL